MKRQDIGLFLLLAALFYLIAAWINADLNSLQWGTAIKVLYALGGVITALILTSND